MNQALHLQLFWVDEPVSAFGISRLGCKNARDFCNVFDKCFYAPA